MKLLAFAATTSSRSINRQLASYAANTLAEASVEILDLNDYELPLFSEDREAELGQPEIAHRFLEKIKTSDALVISFAEHNGSYTAAYKNLFDWASRITPKVFQGKPMVLLATSPGPGGASRVLGAATQSAPHFDGQVIDSISLPSFNTTFDTEAGKIAVTDIDSKVTRAMQRLRNQVLTSVENSVVQGDCYAHS